MVDVRSALSGSLRAIHRTLLTVNAATGTLPTASAHMAGPPSSVTRSLASGADRVSFHNKAGRTTSPLSSKATIPCCCPAIEMAETSSSSPPEQASPKAVHHSSGATSVPSGCDARPSRTQAPVSASRTTTFTDWVEVSTPATRDCSVTGEPCHRSLVTGRGPEEF